MSKKAAIYARVSTAKQGDGYSLPTQIESCRNYATELGFEVVHEFVDKLSGETLERPELQKAIRLAGEINALFCYVQDRLARTNEVDALYLIHDLSKKGIEVYLAHDRKLAETDTFIRQLETLVRAKVAREEREKILERMMRGKRGKMKEGKVVSSTAPFGYRKTEDDYLVVDPIDAVIVRQIFNWYVFGDETGKRMGLAAIGKRLTQQGVLSPADRNGYGRKSKAAGVWSTGSISYILKNPTYKGEWRGGTPPIIISVPVIIEPEMWELAQAQGRKNSNNAQRNTKNSYLLRSVMTCVDCGYRFHGFPHSQTGKLYYRCGGQHIQNSPDYRGGVCHGYLVGEVVDTLIWNTVADILKCPDLILAQFALEHKSQQAESQNLRDYAVYCLEQIKSLETQRAKLLDLYLTDRIPEDLFEEKQFNLDEQITNHRTRFSELQERLAEISTVPDDYEERIRTFCESVEAGIDNFTEAEKRTVIEVLDIHVYAKRGNTREEDTFELTGFIPLCRLIPPLLY